jgi:hypothetical protein
MLDVLLDISREIPANSVKEAAKSNKASKAKSPGARLKHVRTTDPKIGLTLYVLWPILSVFLTHTTT